MMKKEQIEPDNNIIGQPNILNGVNLEAVTGLFKTVATAPTNKPQKISDQIQFYDDTLYFYDAKNDVWRKIATTT